MVLHPNNYSITIVTSPTDLCFNWQWYVVIINTDKSFNKSQTETKILKGLVKYSAILVTRARLEKSSVETKHTKLTSRVQKLSTFIDNLITTYSEWTGHSKRPCLLILLGILWSCRCWDIWYIHRRMDMRTDVKRWMSTASCSRSCGSHITWSITWGGGLWVRLHRNRNRINAWQATDTLGVWGMEVECDVRQSMQSMAHTVEDISNPIW